MVRSIILRRQLERHEHRRRLFRRQLSRRAGSRHEDPLWFRQVSKSSSSDLEVTGHSDTVQRERVRRCRRLPGRRQHQQAYSASLPG